MRYLYFKSEKGNFGDDLNPWLWEQLFGTELDQKDACFFGIGSILHNGNKHLKALKKDEKKIVFGTGVRPAKDYSRFTVDDTWDIRFLRGPLSSFALGGKYPYITDAAYAIRQIPDFSKRFLNKEKKYKTSLMPYFHSVEYFDWKKLCDELGYHYISPYSENGVEETLNEIAASEQLITEAMHGAILADALRVPWHRFILSTPHTEGGLVSEFKWNDWLLSVGMSTIESTFIPFYSKGRVYEFFKNKSKGLLSVETLHKKKILQLMLSKLSKPNGFMLSDDKVLFTLDDKMVREVERILGREN